MKLDKLHTIAKYCLMLAALFPDKASAQITSSKTATGHLLDAAEEYWPAGKDSLYSKYMLPGTKHVKINNDGGFISFAGTYRFGYDYFNDYLWGIGKQDDNGYFLHRLLTHIDLRPNNWLRTFAELETSIVMGRNGGPRPVQDENKFAVNQLFAEVRIAETPHSLVRLRIGKQAISYGIGSLLDVRDANVRLSFAGAKFIINHKSTKADLFYLNAIKNNPESFDDQLNKGQRIGGIWLKRSGISAVLSEMNAYYLYTDRTDVTLSSGMGKDLRNTLGFSAAYQWRVVGGYTEADLQWGKFNDDRIQSWKIIQSLYYKIESSKYKPVFSLHYAMSSGDNNKEDGKLQTFSPLYPRAVYYGYMDNIGSANLIAAHLKLEASISTNSRVSLGYYKFRRFSENDGIYFANGSLMLPATNFEKDIAKMYDMNISYTHSKIFTTQLLFSYADRGKFLTNQPSTKADISYVGIRTTLFL